jgi:hypothetical protein
MHRLQAAVIASALAVTLPGCTLLGAGTGAGAVAVHNWDVPNDHPEDDWSVTTGTLVGAGIGLVADLVLIFILMKQWSKPST